MLKRIDRFFKRFTPGLFAWTPLIQASDFTGIQTDVSTVATGIISVLLVIVGIGILVKVLGR